MRLNNALPFSKTVDPGPPMYHSWVCTINIITYQYKEDKRGIISLLSNGGKKKKSSKVTFKFEKLLIDGMLFTVEHWI